MKLLLDDLVKAVEIQNLNVLNVIVRKDGEVIAKHSFVEDKPLLLYSVSKTFTSMAVGLAAAEGYFNLTDKIVNLFYDYIPNNPSESLQEMTVRDLLCMGTGHAADPIQKEVDENIPNPNITAAFFSNPLLYKPGTHFAYNNAATYLLSLLIKNKTNINLKEYLIPRLFKPLNIPNPQWDCCPNGIPLGCTGLHLSAENLCKVGQLLLDKGEWNGKQLLPADYIKEATSKQISTHDFDKHFATADHHQGYGYQVWLNSYPNSCRMDGFLGQYVILLPDKNSVVTYTSNERKNMTAIIELTWNTLVDKL